MTDKQPLLKVRDLCTYFYTEEGIVYALDDVSFDVARGQTLGIVGESGSGKSVTALSIMRLVQSPPGRIVSGTVELLGEDILKKSRKEMKQIRGGKIGMIFQEPMTSLNPVYTVGNQIMESILLHSDCNRKQAKERAIEMLRLVGIPLPEKRDYETLAGFVLSHMHHLPQVGEHVDVMGWRFEVMDLDGRRIDKVLAQKRPAPHRAA